MSLVCIVLCARSHSTYPVNTTGQVDVVGAGRGGVIFGSRHTQAERQAQKCRTINHWTKIKVYL